jgi:hypothetical protein
MNINIGNLFIFPENSEIYVAEQIVGNTMEAHSLLEEYQDEYDDDIKVFLLKDVIKAGKITKDE